jgi:hypothetical protein
MKVIGHMAYAPSVCVVSNTYVECVKPELPPRENRLVFGITPAGPKSVYQFVAVAQTFPSHHPALFDDLRHLLMEDIIVLNDIQSLFDTLAPDRVPEVKAVPLGPVVAEDAFNPGDLEGAAGNFPDLEFEIVHGGIAFSEEAGWLLARFGNIYINLEASNIILERRPRTFCKMLMDLVNVLGMPMLDRFV